MLGRLGNLPQHVVVWANLLIWPETARDRGDAVVICTRTFALSPQSVGIMCGSVGSRQPLLTIGNGEAGEGYGCKPEIALTELDVTRVLPGFTTNYTIPAKHSLGFVVLW